MSKSKKVQHPKMDPYKIAGNQPWEVRYCRLIFYKVSNDVISHPTTAEVKALIKTHHNSRKRVYLSLAEAGYIKKEIGFHSLRHSFATHLLEKGIDVKYIKEILGHFDIRTTERYLHVSKENLVNIISPLDTLYDYDPSAPLQIGEINSSKKPQQKS